ncbi:hypothetical protein HNQ51_003044 [Inhella inkyongensis]|uniref:Putative auto-transporter adhesin head GIN domain-containing protein n=1 Tax=Inhella inkyongensis TaxID=392593 RepID=A0A840S3B7_9BURK|nr:head GIN domain-containing protein [Inhella inkyongensis]MBB5205717.1 hypothetical protein [Inhella inkyongensis]
MRRSSLPVRALALCCALTVSGLAMAEEQEWVLRIKNEAKHLSITLGGTTLYGSGGQRAKGSGQLVDRARSVAPFTRVRVDGPLDVHLHAAAAEGLRVQADDNIEPLIQTSVEGDTLVIGVRAGASFSSRQSLRVAVDFKRLQGLMVRGSGDVRLDQYKGDRLELDMSGSGDVAVGLVEARELSARLSGSGDLRVAGAVERQDFHLSGSGDVDAASLSGQQVRAKLSGSGDLRLGVAQELDADLSGSGDLAYAGRPKVKSQVSGSGELIARR